MVIFLITHQSATTPTTTTTTWATALPSQAGHSIHGHHVQECHWSSMVDGEASTMAEEESDHPQQEVTWQSAEYVHVW